MDTFRIGTESPLPPPRRPSETRTGQAEAQAEAKGQGQGENGPRITFPSCGQAAMPVRATEERKGEERILLSPRVLAS